MATEPNAEYATVGGVLLAPAQLAEVSRWLRPSDFSRPPARTIFQLALLVHARGDPVDPITVLAELRRRGQLRRDGYPASEIPHMLESLPVPASTTCYARIVLAQSVSRQVAQVGQRLVQLGSRDREMGELFASVGEQVDALVDARRRWMAATGQPAPDLERTDSREPVSLRQALAELGLPGRDSGLAS
jgi:replicative DNA helicase